MPAVLPFAGLRFVAPASELERLVCPPYDVISPDEQTQLLQASPHNAVRLELPPDEPDEPGSRYQAAARHLATWRTNDVLRSDPPPVTTWRKPPIGTPAASCDAATCWQRLPSSHGQHGLCCPTNTRWPSQRRTDSSC